MASNANFYSDLKAWQDSGAADVTATELVWQDPADVSKGFSKAKISNAIMDSTKIDDDGTERWDTLEGVRKETRSACSQVRLLLRISLSLLPSRGTTHAHMRCYIACTSYTSWA